MIGGSGIAVDTNGIIYIAATNYTANSAVAPMGNLITIQDTIKLDTNFSITAD